MFTVHLVSFLRYFVGKKAMFDSEFKKGKCGQRMLCMGKRVCKSAAEYLEFAFDKCYISSRHNKR